MLVMSSLVLAELSLSNVVERALTFGEVDVGRNRDDGLAVSQHGREHQPRLGLKIRLKLLAMTVLSRPTGVMSIGTRMHRAAFAIGHRNVVGR